MPRFLRAPFLLLALSALTIPLPVAGASMADKWVAGLKEVDRMLRAQQWDDAAKQAQRVSRQMVGDAGRDRDVAYSLAVVSAFRAIAEAGLGHQDEADWYWDIALNLVPGIGATDLSPYGAPAAELKKRTLRTAHQAPKVRGNLWTGDEQEVPGAEVERPKVARQVKPEYPDALIQERVPGQVVVEAIVGTDGRLSRPLILNVQGGGPGMKYAALEALGQWRFEPARLRGQPVRVYYVVTINFKIGR
jgi:TonB family protein